MSTSAKENVTEMYSDKLSTLDFGVSEVYYQSVDGFFKQPAAIIKNGVVTNIGEVTPEPTPTPTLEGTWVLNERLYAPESDFDETTGYRFKVGTIECTRIRTSNLTHLSAYKVFSGDTVDIYTFSTNTWKTTARTLTFPAGATASDEFREWLASNATKQ